MNELHGVSPDSLPESANSPKKETIHNSSTNDPIDVSNEIPRRRSSVADSGASATSRASIGRRSIVGARGSIISRASALLGRRRSSFGNISDTQRISGGDFWTTLANDEARWNDIDDDDFDANEQFSFRKLCIDANHSLRESWKIFVSYPYIPLVTFVILAFLLSVSTITVVKLNQEHRNTKVSNGLGVAMDTGLWFRQQLDKSIFPLFALSELVKEMPIFHDLFFKIGRGGEPGSAPYRNDTVITHRNVTGICDNSTLVAAFNKIGKRVKDDADLGGALSTVNLAPMGVVCLFYPFNNTEDFTPPNYLDSTGAFGHDVFKDPKRVASATATLPSSVPVTAGPRTLVQCKGCPTAVRVAFIAMLPIVMPPGMGYNITAEGKTYSVFGFVSAIINWERLLNQSNIFDRFESKGIQFELSKTDQIFNTTTNRYDFQTSVLVKSSKANNIGARNFFNVTLPTTNNNWTIGVAYEDGINAPWYQWAIAASVILSTVISILLGFILVEKQQHSNLLTEILPPKAITKLQNNIVVVDKFNMATIFQSDIIGYTSMSAEMTPIMVMKMLNSFYEGVDKLANKHKVYKIKIIGDAYVCAAGCPYACSGPDGAERIALFALDIMEYTKNFRTDGGAEISLRAGIHSGPVVAGVVGKLRPQYTLFGNSVTVAAKMESTSSKMKIQCSNITWQLLQSAPRYSFTFSNVKKEIDNHDSDTIERTWFIEGAKLI